MDGVKNLQGLLNNSRHMAHTCHVSDQAHNGRECSKNPNLPEGFVQICSERSRRKGRSRFDAGSVHFVREPEGGKTATMSGRSQGTPLAALRPDSGQACFNIPLHNADS